MRVLVVAHAFPPDGNGGTERYAEAAARALAARGHAVEVFAGSLDWRERFEVTVRDEAGLRVTRAHRSDLYFDHWDKVNDPHVAAVYERELERFRPEVVHLHHWIRLSDDLVRRARARGIPAVVHLHDLIATCPRVFRIRPARAAGAAAGDIETCDEPLGPESCRGCVPRWKFQRDAEIDDSLRWFARAFDAELRAAAARVAPSRGHAALLSRFLAAGGGAIEVLEHPRLSGGIDGPGTDARSPAGRLRLLYFAHLLPMKGAHVLLEAMRRLGPGSGVSLDAHGPFATPEYEARLRALAQGLDVAFHGAYSRDEPRRTPADAVVIPTLARESYSFQLDEAARLGLPVIAAASGAIPERATARVRLHPPGDVEALAAILRELRDDPSERARLAAAPPPAVLAAEEHFARLESLLSRAIAAASGWPRGAPSPPGDAEIRAWDRREIAFRELLRSEGWEEVLGAQHAELQRLSRELSRPRPENARGPDPAPVERAEEPRQ